MRYSSQHNRTQIRQTIDAMITCGSLKLSRGYGVTANPNPAQQLFFYERDYHQSLPTEQEKLLNGDLFFTTEASLCSVGMAEWLFENPDVIKGKVFVDLAAGSGFLAIAAKRVGASRSTAIDINGEALIRRNAKANQTRIRVVSDSIFSHKARQCIAQADVIALSRYFVPWERGESGDTIQDILLGRAEAGATILSAAMPHGCDQGWRKLAALGTPIRPTGAYEQFFESKAGRDPDIVMVKVNRQTLGLGS